MAELLKAKAAPAFNPAEQVGLKSAAPEQNPFTGRKQSANVHEAKRRYGDRWLPRQLVTEENCHLKNRLQRLQVISEASAKK